MEVFKFTAATNLSTYLKYWGWVGVPINIININECSVCLAVFLARESQQLSRKALSSLASFGAHSLLFCIGS